MSGLHEAFDEIVADVPVYGDLDRAIEQADRERRHRYGVVAGLAAAAAVLVVIAGIVAVSRDTNTAPPISPSPSPTPSLEFESPGPEDRPVATYEAGGTLVLATMEQEEHPGSATLWRSDSGRWQKLGTLQHAVPMHGKADSDGTRLSPGPGSRDIIATGVAEGVSQSVGFSRDGGATWSYLATPRTCGKCWIGAHGDYLYVVPDEPTTTLVRAAFGAGELGGAAASPGPGPDDRLSRPARTRRRHPRHRGGDPPVTTAGPPATTGSRATTATRGASAGWPPAKPPASTVLPATRCTPPATSGSSAARTWSTGSPSWWMAPSRRVPTGTCRRPAGDATPATSGSRSHPSGSATRSTGSSTCLTATAGMGSPTC